MSNTNKIKQEKNASIYTRNINLIEDDPLEEIFALNLGDFFTEHLMNPEFGNKILRNYLLTHPKDKRKLERTA